MDFARGGNAEPMQEGDVVAREEGGIINVSSNSAVWVRSASTREDEGCMAHPQVTAARCAKARVAAWAEQHVPCVIFTDGDPQKTSHARGDAHAVEGALYVQAKRYGFGVITGNADVTEYVSQALFVLPRATGGLVDKTLSPSTRGSRSGRAGALSLLLCHSVSDDDVTDGRALRQDESGSSHSGQVGPRVPRPKAGSQKARVCLAHEYVEWTRITIRSLRRDLHRRGPTREIVGDP